VRPGDHPVLLEGERSGDARQQVVGGHHPAGEEVATHPVVVGVGLEEVGEAGAREDVDEELAPGDEPAGDAPEELRPVAHVLEHLHRDHAVEGAGGLEAVHVAGDDLDVGEAAPPGLAEDELPLAGRVGDPHHLRGREVLGRPEGEAPPAAAEFQDAVAVLDAGPLGGEAQHGLLGGIEGGDALRPVASRVLHPDAQAGAEEGGRDLVVLLVGQRRNRGHLGSLHRCDESGQGGLTVGMAPLLVADSVPEESPDAEADDRGGDESSLR
jgi:hypothetical protein